MVSYSPEHRFDRGPVLALSGGVGGAKLALGLSRLVEPSQLSVVCNTADDFEHLGLPISPDLDTVMYTLAGLANKELGWGLEGESWQFMAAMEALQGDTWFRLGDRDLATHIMRRELLRNASLSQVTEQLCQRLGVTVPVLPMSDQPVRTIVHCDQGDLSFQHYFVREQCRPVVTGFSFEGLEAAQPSPGFAQRLQDPELQAIIICPSNPFVSVAPILGLTGVVSALKASPVPVIAVSPIVGGKAIKGPAAKMLTELGYACSAKAVLEYYAEFVDGFIIDQQDAEQLPELTAATAADNSVAIQACQTVMHSLQDREDLANAVLGFAQSLRG